MLADELKDHTKSVHAALEKQLLSRLKSMRSHKDYANLLSMMFGYYTALEEQCSPYLDGVLEDFSRRRKAAMLLTDLHALNAATDNLRLCLSVPSIDSYESAMGAMYVLEGSTLGGKIISSLVDQALTLRGEATNFFKSYGDDTMAMWLSFKEKLNAISVNNDRRSAVMKTAHDTFTQFKTWIEKHDQQFVEL